MSDIIRPFLIFTSDGSLFPIRADYYGDSKAINIDDTTLYYKLLNLVMNIGRKNMPYKDDNGIFYLNEDYIPNEILAVLIRVDGIDEDGDLMISEIAGISRIISAINRKKRERFYNNGNYISLTYSDNTFRLYTGLQVGSTPKYRYDSPVEFARVVPFSPFYYDGSILKANLNPVYVIKSGLIEGEEYYYTGFILRPELFNIVIHEYESQLPE